MTPRWPDVVLATAGLGLLAACATGGEQTGAPPSGLGESSTPPPSLPISYEYLLSSSCGERALIGDYRVVVQDGDVVEVTGLDPEYAYRPAPQDVPSLADLLRMAEEAEPDAIVELVTGADGVPVSLSIDHMPSAIDDEECYEVSELVVTSP